MVNRGEPTQFCKIVMAQHDFGTFYTPKSVRIPSVCEAQNRGGP